METIFWLVVPGLATGLGGLCLLVVPHPGERLLDTLLGATAGIMLAASMFSLLVPALEDGAVWEVVTGFVVGAAALAVLDATLPHVHERIVERRPEPEEHHAALMLGALTIHNVPEGLAVGVAFAAGGSELGVPIAVAIGLQNIPEGFAAAAPILRAGGSTALAIGFAAATGLVEPPAAILGFAIAESMAAILPAALAFAAGAMVYVVVDEIVPESHGRGYEREATGGVVLGFVAMMVLDNAFG